jgi:hypothetical protein
VVKTKITTHTIACFESFAAGHSSDLFKLYSHLAESRCTIEIEDLTGMDLFTRKIDDLQSQILKENRRYQPE